MKLFVSTLDDVVENWGHTGPYESMKNITVYIGPMCSYCDAAKRLLNKKNIPYKEINIALEEGKMEEMLKKSNGMKTIPQIFIEDHHIGGYDELRALENKGELDKLIN